MSLDQETVKQIAILARLKLSTERIDPIQQELNHILDFINQLNEVDTSHVKSMTSVNTTSMPFHKDKVDDGGYVETILTNAPDVACNMFVVPKVVE